MNAQKCVFACLLGLALVLNMPLSASATPTSDQLVATLMPLPVGDPTFDEPEADLATLAPGDIIKVVDLGPFASLKAFTPNARTYLVKVRSTTALGVPTWATGTLLVPNNPWMGPGTRPLLVNNLPIDSLGRKCTVSYKMIHNESLEHLNVSDLPPTTAAATLLKNYAVLLPDHQGPNMAYGDGVTAAHSVSDVVRGVYRHWSEFSQSKFAMTGYSGGAIATGWTAKLLAQYAPDLLTRYVGSAFGGVPADFGALRATMDGTAATGLYGAALVGQIRGGHPELAELARPEVQVLANGIGGLRFQEQCAELLIASGLTFAPMWLFANVPDPYATVAVQDFLTESRMAGTTLAGPLYLYNGSSDLWIPNHAVADLAVDQQSRGVPTEYHQEFIEHLSAAVTGWGGAADWLTRQLG